MTVTRTRSPAVSPAVRLYTAWLVSVVATLGSLYFSEIARYVPCTLCWYQRIAMYPLVILLGVGAYHDDLSVRRSALPLAGIGWLIAAYHVLEERGLLPVTAACTVGVPCTVRWIDWFGFITIPALSLTAFTLILALLAWRRNH